MFTGIIETQGRILKRTPVGQSLEFILSTPYSDLTLGESIAINGVCLTVANLPEIKVFVSPETLRVTCLGSLREGSEVNLERALLPTTRLSGHFVQGHVDGVGKIVAIKPLPEGSTELQIQVPASIFSYCFRKGSLTLDGVSLTINDLDPLDRAVSFHLIPHTLGATNLKTAQVGQEINLEADVISKVLVDHLDRISHSNKGNQNADSRA